MWTAAYFYILCLITGMALNYCGVAWYWAIALAAAYTSCYSVGHWQGYWQGRAWRPEDMGNTVERNICWNNTSETREEVLRREYEKAHKEAMAIYERNRRRIMGER